jgi:hypothetical protein
VTAASIKDPDGLAHLARRDVLQRALGASPVVPPGKLSPLDRVVPQATQLPLLNRLVQMTVLGESDLTWLQRKIGFKSLRNVYYYVEAARWARLLDEDEVRPTSLGRRYVDSRFDPRVVLEGVRGRALFEEVMRLTGGDVPTPDVVAGVLRRWSFRYSKGTLARRARDFCRLFGSIIEQAASPAELKLVVHTAWVEPRELLTMDGVAIVWPVHQLVPLAGFRRGTVDPAPAADDPQLRLRLEEDA